MAWDFERESDALGVHHTTVIYWLKLIGEKLPDAPPIKDNDNQIGGKRQAALASFPLPTHDYHFQ